MTLASLDFLGDLQDLRERVQHLPDQLGDEFHEDAQHQGADQSDSVWVGVDARGRVTSLDISRRWRDRLVVSDFPLALYEAYTAAVRKSMEAGALASARSAPVSADRPRTSLALPEPELGDDEWRRARWDRLDVIRAELRRLAERDPSPSRQERAVSGPDGYVTLRLLGEDLVGITGEVGRIARADVELIRTDALAAFQRAGLCADTWTEGWHA
ncbi:hypothetical protein [Micromonospora violae]|uniref:hypothetical protein n=1 Tax=Micromonospora violae TaxID=1278207 RepID=UPI0033D619C1